MKTTVNWAIIPILLSAIIAIWLLKRAGQFGTADAIRLLQQGARVVDVRTPPEFARDPVPGAVNIPLDELERRADQELPDKDQALLLHCLSGGRSLVAVGRLRRLGYRNVHNLGSVGRARSLVLASRPSNPASSTH